MILRACRQLPREEGCGRSEEEAATPIEMAEETKFMYQGFEPPILGGCCAGDSGTSRDAASVGTDASDGL